VAARVVAMLVGTATIVEALQGTVEFTLTRSAVNEPGVWVIWLNVALPGDAGFFTNAKTLTVYSEGIVGL
jgi:hypothetical protein